MAAAVLQIKSYENYSFHKLFKILIISKISLLCVKVDGIKEDNSRFIYNSLDIQSCYRPGILCGLALGVVKVGWDSNYCLRHVVLKVPFGYFLHLA